MSRKRIGRAGAVALLAAAAAAAGVQGMHVNASPARYPDGSVFDPEYYLKANPDVAAIAAADDDNDAFDAWEHYTEHGFAEGRLPFDPASLTTDLSDIPEKGYPMPDGTETEDGAGAQGAGSGQAAGPAAPAGTYSHDTMVGALDSAADGKGLRLYNTAFTFSPQMQQKLAAATAAFEDGSNQVGWLVADLESGAVFAYNPRYVTYSASCIKGPYIFSLLAAGNAPTNDMYLAGHNSDNNAYSRIRKKYGSAVMMNWLKGAGADEKLGRTNYTFVCPVDLAKMWCHAYEYLTTPGAQTQWAKDTFTHSLNSAISETMGSVQSYSKAGWIYPEFVHPANPKYNVYTNAGLVMADHPYVIALVSYNNPNVGKRKALNLVPVLNEAHQELAAWNVIQAQQAEAAKIAAAQQAAAAQEAGG